MIKDSKEKRIISNTNYSLGREGQENWINYAEIFHNG
jgi:hypothetical protein